MLDGVRLVVTGFPVGGGTFIISDEGIHRCDWVNAGGMCVVGDELAVVEWSDPSPATVHVGNRKFQVDANNPHDLVFDGENLVLVSTGTDELIWFSPVDGKEIKRQRLASGLGRDNWHISGLTSTSVGLAYTCFGRYEEEIGWVGNFREDAAGVLALVDGDDILTGGLRGPHTPVLREDGWWCCSSADHSVVTPDGSIVFETGWTRGLAYTETRIFVGLSSVREPDETGRGTGPASVAVLDYDRNVLGFIQVPSPQIYSIVVLPDSITLEAD